MSYWGYHAIFDCANCDFASITNPDVLKEWVEALVEEIEMVPYGDPQIIHFGHNEEHLAGWTVLQFIETSNIMAHFCDNSREAYIDVFSCKPFSVEIALEVISRFFHPTKIRTTFLTRQADTI
jgi:S-adenosylmethionine/arginine decarboxylase-like enzyme